MYSAWGKVPLLHIRYMTFNTMLLTDLSCFAGRHSAAGMQTTQLPASSSRARLHPVQSASVSTQHPSNAASSQACHQTKHFAAKPDSGTQAGISVGLGVPKGSSSGSQDLLSIDLTAESDDNSK